MTNQPSVRSNRSYLTVAAAIVIAAVLISATIFATLGSSSTSTKTVPETTTITETSTLTSTSTKTVPETTTITETSTLTSVLSNTSTTRTIQTCTDIPNLSFMYCGSNPLRISEEFEASSGEWNFTVSINSSSVARGHPIQLIASLTNIGPNETVKEFIQPFINPEVYAANGSELWQWNPPQTTSPNTTFPSGQTISQSMVIPTSQLHSGQTYPTHSRTSLHHRSYSKQFDHYLSVLRQMSH